MKSSLQPDVEPTLPSRGTAPDPAPPTGASLRFALPKGRIEPGVLRLLADAGISVTSTARSYRPALSLPDVDVKRMKPQNIVEMLGHGSRDLGFAGADWVRELDADIVELVDTGLDPVRVVAAAPRELAEELPERLQERRLVVASEYQRLAQGWIERQGLAADFTRTYGATEVFPPDDADMIIDNTSTGSTLEANGLVIVDTLMTSSTRLYASRGAYEHPGKRARIDDFVMLIESVLEARSRVMLEVNVSRRELDAVVDLLPSMRAATVAPLFADRGLAIKAAVPRRLLPELIPAVRAAGGNDLVVTEISQIVP